MPKYTKEFKAKAVQLSALDGVMIKDAAESLDIHPRTLSRWRKEYREGRIVVDKRQEVVKAHLKGISDSVRVRQLKREGACWERNFAAYKDYVLSTSQQPGPTTVHNGIHIGYWIARQRSRFRMDTLRKDQAKQLKEFLGPRLDPMKERWEHNFEAYKHYVESTGKQPQKRTIHNGIRIGNWVVNIRQSKRKLSNERIERLEKLGIKWRMRQRIEDGRIEWDLGITGDLVTVTLHEKKGKRILRGHRADGLTWTVEPAKK